MAKYIATADYKYGTGSARLDAGQVIDSAVTDVPALLLKGAPIVPYTDELAAMVPKAVYGGPFGVAPSLLLLSGPARVCHPASDGLVHIYVDKISGSDAYTGQAATNIAGNGPYKSIPAGLRRLEQYVATGATSIAVLQLGDGTYGEEWGVGNGPVKLMLNLPPLKNSIVIRGNTAGMEAPDVALYPAGTDGLISSVPNAESMTDTTAAWSTNQYRGYILSTWRVADKAGSQRWSTIRSNTNNTLNANVNTAVGGYLGNVAANDGYRIVKPAVKILGSLSVSNSNGRANAPLMQYPGDAEWQYPSVAIAFIDFENPGFDWSAFYWLKSNLWLTGGSYILLGVMLGGGFFNNAAWGTICVVAKDCQIFADGNPMSNALIYDSLGFPFGFRFAQCGIGIPSATQPGCSLYITRTDFGGVLASGAASPTYVDLGSSFHGDKLTLAGPLMIGGGSIVRLISADITVNTNWSPYAVNVLEDSSCSEEGSVYTTSSGKVYKVSDSMLTIESAISVSGTTGGIVFTAKDSGKIRLNVDPVANGDVLVDADATATIDTVLSSGKLIGSVTGAVCYVGV